MVHNAFNIWLQLTKVTGLLYYFLILPWQQTSIFHSLSEDSELVLLAFGFGWRPGAWVFGSTGRMSGTRCLRGCMGIWVSWSIDLWPLRVKGNSTTEAIGKYHQLLQICREGWSCRDVSHFSQQADKVSLEAKVHSKYNLKSVVHNEHYSYMVSLDENDISKIYVKGVFQALSFLCCSALCSTVVYMLLRLALGKNTKIYDSGSHDSSPFLQTMFLFIATCMFLLYTV